MRHRLLTAVFPAVCLCVVASTASAQFRIQIGNGHNSHGHGGIVQPHIDHHDHVIRDSHGHVRGIQHHDVIHGGTHGVVPSIGGAHIDHHDHIVRDRHGHVIGTQHHDVVHNDWSHIVPNTISWLCNRTVLRARRSVLLLAAGFKPARYRETSDVAVRRIHPVQRSFRSIGNARQ